MGISQDGNRTEEERLAEAAKNYQKAAENKPPDAQALWNLGYMHHFGDGLPRDLHMAKRYYDRSIETSRDAYVPAMLALSLLYSQIFHEEWIAPYWSAEDF